MSEMIRFILCVILCAGGLFTLISGVVGVFRFRYCLSRIHAAALYDTVGVLLMLAAVMLAEGATVATLKMLAAIAILWMTSPVSSHLIARLEVTTNDQLSQSMTVDSPELVAQEKEVP